MPTSDEILLNELLMEREEYFGTVFNLEQEVYKVLGTEIDLESPINLPSKQKRKKKSKVPKIQKKKSFKLRKLKESEAAFSVKYQNKDDLITEKLIDPLAIETLIQTPPKFLVILSVHTVSMEDIAIDCLYSKEIQSLSSPVDPFVNKNHKIFK